MASVASARKGTKIFCVCLHDRLPFEERPGTSWSHPRENEFITGNTTTISQGLEEKRKKTT
jgi:hypothetical protein